MYIHHNMHIPISKGKVVSIHGRGVLLKKIPIKALPVEVHGGAIITNRIVGITSNAVAAPPSNTMASIGAGIDFSKHVKHAAKTMQRRKEKEENIRFIF